VSAAENRFTDRKDAAPPAAAMVASAPLLKVFPESESILHFVALETT
jgi:hypothetical protein